MACKEARKVDPVQRENFSKRGGSYINLSNFFSGELCELYSVEALEKRSVEALNYRCVKQPAYHHVQLQHLGNFVTLLKSIKIHTTVRPKSKIR